MIRFTDPDTGAIYTVDTAEDEISLYYRADEESPLRMVPMSPTAAAMLAKTLGRYANVMLEDAAPVHIDIPAPEAVVVPFQMIRIEGRV